jgi:hypothetical protein
VEFWEIHNDLEDGAEPEGEDGVGDDRTAVLNLDELFVDEGSLDDGDAG